MKYNTTLYFVMVWQHSPIMETKYHRDKTLQEHLKGFGSSSATEAIIIIITIMCHTKDYVINLHDHHSRGSVLDSFSD